MKYNKLFEIIMKIDFKYTDREMIFDLHKKIYASICESDVRRKRYDHKLQRIHSLGMWTS